jgi:hypothetical protein
LLPRDGGGDNEGSICEDVEVSEDDEAMGRGRQPLMEKGMDFVTADVEIVTCGVIAER